MRGRIGRRWVLAAGVALLVVLGVTAFAVSRQEARPRTAAPAPTAPALPALAGAVPAGPVTGPAPRLVPVPASLRRVPGEPFTLTQDSRVVVAGPGAEPVGELAAALLRRGTGYPLPVVSGTRPAPHDLVLAAGGPASLGKEGYTLEVDRRGALLTAATAEGLFRGLQTFRQLLPPEVESSSAQAGPWTATPVAITDRPRFAWRGVMLDVARHFFEVAEVKRYVDLAALHKVNVLHLHLTDDQGWRLEIDGWPRLTSHGGSTQVGGGPGGYYTQAQYAEIVRYAGERFVTVVPEIDVPGHTNAALASYPELACDGKAPPLHTGTRVGFSTLCPAKEVTYRFLDDVVRQVAALTPGEYVHVGGDEAYETERRDYLAFMARAQEIVHAHGKKLIGWTQVATTPLEQGSMAQYYHAAYGSNPRTKWAHSAAAQKVPLIMSPAARAYLDMKYDASTPIGLDWAGLVDVQTSYDWDPVTFVHGLGPADVYGVEAALWTETVRTMAQVEYLAYPRLAGIAEIGWSPATGRSWDDYRQRLAAQGPRWTVRGVRFHRAPEVPWPAGTGGLRNAPIG